MRTKKILATVLILSLFFSINADAQVQQKAFFGFGAGLDYGGLGIRGEFVPVKNLGVFAGFGYNLADPAFNAGLSCKLAPGKKIVPVLTAMYGYNAAIKVKYAYGNVYSKTYYGPSIGAGCELFDRQGKGKWLLELLVPFRSADFHDEYDALKDSGVDFNPDILPVTFTVGYNFSVSSKGRK